ncbi:hypothetical protein [Thalassiella azotivora]
MTTSPAFLREVADQAALAKRQLAAAEAVGDEAAASAAANRLLDLDEIAARASDATLVVEDAL